MVDEGTARPRVAEAVRLLRDGLAPLEIAGRLGLSRSMTYQLLTDPTDEKNRARKVKHGGTCESCGARTSYGNGDGPARLCNRCYRAQYAERNAEIERRWRAGKTAVEIAADLDVSPAAVQSWVDTQRRKHGRDLPLHRRRNRELWPEIERLWNEGWTIARIAAEVGIEEGNCGFRIQAMRRAGWNVPRRRRARAVA